MGGNVPSIPVAVLGLPTFSTYFRGFVKTHGLLRYEEFEEKIDLILQLSFISPDVKEIILFERWKYNLTVATRMKTITFSEKDTKLKFDKHVGIPLFI